MKKVINLSIEIDIEEDQAFVNRLTVQNTVINARYKKFLASVEVHLKRLLESEPLDDSSSQAYIDYATDYYIAQASEAKAESRLDDLAYEKNNSSILENLR